MLATIDTVMPQDTLWERVQQAISASPYFTKEHIHFETRSGDVRLVGKVKTYFEKQMAQETILRLDGVERVENQLQVH